ncbi:MAG: phage portal protein [Pseudomonadota bacterium]
MSLLTRLLGATDGDREGPRDPLDDFWYGGAARATAAGVAVTLDNALTIPVVQGCLSVLSQTVASLPHGVFERRQGGDKRRLERHPLLSLLAAPDRECTTHEWLAQLVWDLAGAGNAMFRLREQAGIVIGLDRLDPQRTTVERLPDGSRRWNHTGLDGRMQRLVEGEVWHLRDVPLIDQLVGQSRIHAGRETIGQLMALQAFAAAYFERDATPPFFIAVDGQFKDQASKKNFMEAIKRWFGSKRRGPATLEYGAKVHKLGATAEEAQFLETRKELQGEVARLWRMPPHKVQMLENATFSNIEHQGLEFVTDTLMPWVDLIEGAVNRFLIGDNRRYFFEFDVSGLLRGDIKARFEAYAKARQWGWLSVNEIRAMENRNAIGAAGDRFLDPLNMKPAGSARDERAALYDGTGRLIARHDGIAWIREVA